MSSSSSSLKAKILAKAQDIGFSAVGIARVHASTHDSHLRSWLNSKYNASMDWMLNHVEKRIDPSLLVPGSKTVLMVADSYLKNKDIGGKHIARYAQGKDYHQVLKNKLHLLFDYIKTLKPSVQGRVFVDSAPVLEHYWAKQAGVGWIGKNTLTITRSNGSFVFLGEIISDLDLPPDAPATNHCGTCTACLDACPTNAFPQPYVLDANKCISYLTIEHRGNFTENQADSIGEHVYGCDVCLDVCPWNHNIKQFSSKDYEELPINPNDLQEIAVNSSEDFNKKYTDSPIVRTRFEGLKRNHESVLNNIKKEKIITKKNF